MASLRAFNLLFSPHANQLARTAIKKSIIPPKKPNFFALTDLENRYKYRPPINNRNETMEELYSQTLDAISRMENTVKK